MEKCAQRPWFLHPFIPSFLSQRCPSFCRPEWELGFWLPLMVANLLIEQRHQYMYTSSQEKSWWVWVIVKNQFNVHQSNQPKCIIFTFSVKLKLKMTLYKLLKISPLLNNCVNFTGLKHRYNSYKIIKTLQKSFSLQTFIIYFYKIYWSSHI